MTSHSTDDQSSPVKLILQPDLQANLDLIASRWAQIKYSIQSDTEQQHAMNELEGFCNLVTDRHPEQAEALAWHGQVVATQGEFASGMGALKFAKQALKLFKTSVAIDETVMDATAHISLGVLYYEVPGWPLGFGSQSDAQKHLSRALELYPDDIEAHYYYAGYQQHYESKEAAKRSLEHSLKLSQQKTDRTLAIEGREKEIQLSLAKLS